MGRKRIFSKPLLFAAMISTIGAGVLSSVPLPVKAAEEEEIYTVRFEAYEGTCGTESVSVPKGESIILPDAVYEGHYLDGWVDAVDEGNMTTFRTIGVAGSEYTPERDLWLYANWKPMEEQDITVIYEARIGDTIYEELEEAFANAHAGDTITVLRDCRVSATLEVTADNIILKSEDAGNPVTISREDDFAGKKYGMNTDSVLLAVKGGSLTTQDIIFDGGAVLDDDFNNSGKVWNSPLIYVDGSYTMESGTVLQNNYNTDGYESNGSGRTLHTAGAVHIKKNASFTMDGGLIQNCYTSGGGGGLQSEVGSHVTATSGTVTNCYATWGGGMDFWGEAELSGMTIMGNAASSSGGGISSTAPLTVKDSLIEGNYSAYDGGGICTATGHKAEISGCIFTGNVAGRGSAVQTSSGEGTLPIVIRNCTFTGNRSQEKIHAGGTICYMNETGIILSGKIVMEDNLSVGYEPCDIHYFYNTGASILLDEDFESDSTFVLGGYDSIKPGRVLIDGTLYHKDASPEQFPWHCPNYCTEKRGENLYLAEVPKTYFVTYDVNNNPDGASDMCSDPNKYTSEETVTIMDQEALFPLLGNIVRFGYNFVGWNTEPDGTGTDYAPLQEINLTDNLYLYAKWEAKEPVTLTYIYNDGEGRTDSAQVIPGANIAFPDASRKGYSFKGWYEDEALTVFAGNAGEKHYAPQKDTSYYAAWEKAEATISFDADGGKMEGGDVTAKIGDTITLPNCTKEGYEFTGWYDGDTCVGQAGEEYTVSDDVTLKARYEKKETEAVICTVTFDADGGDTARKSITAEKGSAIILPACSKTGYEFLGWFLASDDSICIGQAGEEFTVQGDISLKAHFEKKEAVKVTITFEADGGKAVNPIKAAKGDMIRLPKTEKEGYRFLGWYTEKDGGILLGIPGSEMKAVKDMTAYALWEKEAEENTDSDADPETCKVTFHAGQGTIKVKELTIIKDGSLYLPMPEREGYDFTGWYLDDELTQFAGAYHDTYRITRDTDFYAKWEKSKDNSGNNGDSENNGNTEDNDNSGETLNTYTIKYDANGGKTKNASVKVVIGGSVKLPGAEREGYSFKGWYTDRQVFIGTEGETYKPSRSISLYARWEKTEENNKNGKDDQNTSDKNQNTSGTVSGNSAGSPSDKDTDTKTEGGNGNAGKGTEPVIQTGHASPFYLLAALGLCGVMLAAASVLEGKKKGKSCL
ncbi:MAG: InlB B-repeat-containing protein [Lachnospiraceae bacterium]|nr:InlB B-repeat-containing protein [Lachnospiraceae bacterium]